MKRMMMFCLLASLLGCEYPESADGDLISLGAVPEDFEELVEIPVTEQPSEYTTSDRKLIKTAQLQFETNDLKATTSRLRTLSSSLAGFIAEEKLEENYDRHWTTVRIKVPSKNFDALIDGISGKVEKFDLMEVSSQDVTEEFMDLGVRVATKKKVEQRYLEILAQAKTIEEILQVEEKAAAVREEIERAEGRLKYLGNRTSMSSVNVAFYQIVPVTETKPEGPSFISNLVQGLENGLGLLKGLFIGLANLWPLILIVGAVIFGYRKKWRKAGPTAS